MVKLRCVFVTFKPSSANRGLIFIPSKVYEATENAENAVIDNPTAVWRPITEEP